MANNWMAWTGIRDQDDPPKRRTIMTKNAAAAEVRHEILRKIRTLEKRPAFFSTIFWIELKTYIQGMAKRASKKRGGLGRR